MNAPHKDTWPWGNELVIWGYSPEHKYTFKILEPKKGRAGCLSLQYHHEKSESWLCVRGIAWALVVVADQVCTRILRAGDVQNLPTGCIHRLMGVSDDVQVAEPSTPDRHAADKSAPKDVVRLHCVLGRDVAKARTPAEATIVTRAIEITEEAIAAIEKGTIPKEYNPQIVMGFGGLKI